MLMQMKAVFDGVSDKKSADGRKIFKGVATSLALDRHREVVVPKGVDLTNYMDNAVLMRQHEHREEPIGRLLSINPGDKDMPFEFIFDEADPEAARVMGKVERGFLNTFSIGFLPTKWVDQEDLVDETGKMLDSVELDIGNNMKYTLDMTQYKATPRRVYTQWEMLEISLVSIPANPEAHVRMIGKELLEAFEDSDPVAKSFIEEEVDKRMRSLGVLLEVYKKEIEDFHIAGVVAPHTTKSTETKFVEDVAKAHLAKWASSDASGEKDTMSWGKYARGFVKFDVEKANTFGAYILLHHDVEGDELVISKDAVTSAMTALLDHSKDSEMGEDGEAIHSHLAQHYRDLGLEVPAFGKDYTDDDLIKILDGTWTAPVEALEKETPASASVEDDRIVKLTEEIAKFREVIETRAIGFNIKFETILESIREITKALAIKQAVVPTDSEVEDEPDVEGVVEGKEVIVAGLKDALAFYSGAGAGN